MNSTEDLTRGTNQSGVTLCLRAAVRMLGSQTIYELLPEPFHLCTSDPRRAGRFQADIYYWINGSPILIAWRGSLCATATSYFDNETQVLGLDPHCVFAQPVLQAFFQRVYTAVAFAFTSRSLRRGEKLQENGLDSLQFYKSLFC